jgi:hypothetical protein
MRRRDFLVALLTIAFSRLVGRIGTPVYGPRTDPYAFRTLGASYLATNGAARRSREFMEGLVDLSCRSRSAAGRILVQRRTADSESEALFCAGLLLPGAMRG